MASKCYCQTAGPISSIPSLAALLGSSVQYVGNCPSGYSQYKISVFHPPGQYSDFKLNYLQIQHVKMLYTALEHVELLLVFPAPMCKRISMQ